MKNVTTEIAFHLKKGMNLEKCRKCGCMAKALEAAEAFAVDGNADDLFALTAGLKSRMARIDYECLGCKTCWAAETMNLLDAAVPSCEAATQSSGKGWPVAAGEYVLGDVDAPVAVCTLADAELPAQIMRKGESAFAIAGKCETENIGIEKIVLNLVANPKIRRLILCGKEAEGHFPGKAMIQLAEEGVDAAMRIPGTPSRKPVLNNLTLRQVTRFRQQVQVVDRIGSTDREEILKLAEQLAADPVSPLPAYDRSETVAPIPAERAKHLKLDKAGFFIIIPNPDTGLITCEHYSYDGRLTMVIEGTQADLIASTAIERGLLTQLDHAAYLGRELAKAEYSMKTGSRYVQDNALGPLTTAEKQKCECTSR